jgi:hypothetical protein
VPELGVLAGSVLAGSTSIPLNNWSHIAVSRSGTGSNNLKMFINGVLVASSTTNTTLVGNGGNNLCIGADSVNDEARFTGYITDLRIVNGTGLYTTDFTPPSVPLSAVNNTVLLLNGTNAGIVDYTGVGNSISPGVSSAAVTTLSSKYGGSSFVFDGVNDSIDFPSIEPHTLYPSLCWTIEGWFYPTNASYTSYRTLLRRRTTTAGQINYMCFLSATNGNLAFQTAASTYASNTPLTLNAWNHVAYTHDGTNLSIYKDGTRVYGPSAVALTNYTGAALVLGRDLNTNLFEGYMDDVRITRGFVRYTGASYTIPSAALPKAYQY